MESNLLEKTVLTKVDELIGILIKLSSEPNQVEKEEMRTKGIEKSQEIIPLLLHFLEGNTQYIEPMFHQIVKEKLPDAKLISSFGRFQEELGIIINKGIYRFTNQPNKNKEKENRPTDLLNEIMPSLQREEKLNKNKLYTLSKKVFPNINIVHNYKIRGQNLDVYIPQFNIGLITEENTKLFARLNYLCKQANIRLLVIPNDILHDSRKLAKYTKSYLL